MAGFPFRLACVIENVRPPAVIVPVRWLPVLAAKVKPTVREPVPDAPLVIVIHDAVVAAVAPHPSCVVNVKLPLPAADPTEVDAGETE